MSNMKSPLPQCASMVRVQNILSGKWKITILWYIAEYESTKVRGTSPKIRRYYTVHSDESSFESWSKTGLSHDMFIKKSHRK